jgi:dTDP-4-amino-4,6-dideoxygalactose transaminase
LTIPLIDLQAQHASIRAELDDAIRAVMAHGRFVAGPEVQLFEERFAEHCDARHCVGVSSGTDALTLALRASGVGPGDEVITTALTFIATVESIVEVGATPVLVDPDPSTALLRVEQVEAAITERTAALVPVHLYGQPVDLAAFRSLADRRGLLLVEDAAQAHGATWNDSTVGSLGSAATFSFFPGKNLGALGDAGAVVTGDATLAERMRSLRDHGRADKHRHDELGVNARLDTLQAAVLNVKLKHLDRWTGERRTHAAAYDAAFDEIPGVDPIRVEAPASSVYHQYVVRVSDRDAALATLRELGVAAGVHYRVPLHRQPALLGVADSCDCPNAERLAGEVLSLPVYPELTERDRQTVVDAVAQHAATGSAATAETRC